MKRTLTAPFKLKTLGDGGQFEGYASIFDNVDLGGDVIKPGAFKEFHLNADGRVIVLLQHNSFDLPIGTARVEQDEKGLRFYDGQLVMEDPTAVRAHAHMKAKTLEGMSIGFDILPGGEKVLESGVRELTALKLWEISPVIWGMNPKASITAVKQRQTITTVTEFEKFLRDVGGFSRSEAKALAAAGFRALHSKESPRDAGELLPDLERISAALSFTPFR